MWQKKVNNDLNFEKSVIIVLNLSYCQLSSVSSVYNDLNLNSFLTVHDCKRYCKVYITIHQLVSNQWTSVGTPHFIRHIKNGRVVQTVVPLPATSETGSGSWSKFLWRPYINYFGACKNHKYFENLCCLTVWFINILFRTFSWPKNFH
jgi:hypothetical protein